MLDLYHIPKFPCEMLQVCADLSRFAIVLILHCECKRKINAFWVILLLIIKIVWITKDAYFQGPFVLLLKAKLLGAGAKGLRVESVLYLWIESCKFISGKDHRCPLGKNQFISCRNQMVGINDIGMAWLQNLSSGEAVILVRKHRLCLVWSIALSFFCFGALRKIKFNVPQFSHL